MGKKIYSLDNKFLSINDKVAIYEKPFVWGEEGAEVDAEWFAGLKNYLKTHSGSSLTTPDGQSILGATKKVVLNEAIQEIGHNYKIHTIQVIGIDQDANNTVTWQTKNIFPQYVFFGSNAIWIGSNVRSLCQQYYNNFPGKDSIKVVSKGTAIDCNNNQNNIATYTDETVWIPSESEMGLDGYSSLTYSNSTISNAECTKGKKFQYSYYSSNINRQKRVLWQYENGEPISGGFGAYMLRSRTYNDSSAICLVQTDGSKGGGIVTDVKYPFAPAFVIGN